MALHGRLRPAAWLVAILLVCFCHHASAVYCFRGEDDPTCILDTLTEGYYRRQREQTERNQKQASFGPYNRLRLRDVRPAATSTNEAVAEAASQMYQVDIQSMLNEGAQTLNGTILKNLIQNGGIGSILNSPTTGEGVGHVPTWDEWREIQQMIYDISTEDGGVPILYGLDSVHGANYIFNATLFPQQIGMAATFNTTVAHEGGRIAGLETRSVGIPWLFSPILGLAVQPSWARVFETFGEDPKLVGDMGVAIIQGIQSPPPPELNMPHLNFTAAACMKHYIGYTNIRTGHDRTPSYIPMNMLLQYFAPPFQRAIQEANVLSVMENYIELNGRPVVASELLLYFLLREVMGFEGMLVTDYNEVFNLFDFHLAANSFEDAIRMSFNATSIDMAMVGTWLPSVFPNVPQTVQELVTAKKLDPDRIIGSGDRVVTLKQQLGLFDGTPVPQPTGCVFACDSHRQAGLDAARQSIVLLQNDGILPLSTEPATAPSSIALIGQGCASVPLMAGGWTIRWQGTNNASAFPYGSSLYSELVNGSYFPPGTIFSYSPGCNVTEDSTCDPTILQEAVALASAANVTIVCVGERHYAEKPGDIMDLTLPGQQIEMVNQLYAVNPNIVLVLVQGRPRVLQNLPMISRAVINAMLPGPSGGQALAEILTGRVNPSGRQPITYPQTLNNAPLQYWRKYSANTGNDYTVQWTFGHGLSYTTFSYENLKAKLHTGDGTVKAEVTVTNTGSRAGAVSVLLYSTQPYRQITPEVQMLRAFTKVFLQPSQSVNVTLEFPFTDLGYYDEYNCMFIDPTTIIFGIQDTLLVSSIEFPILFQLSCATWGQQWAKNTGNPWTPSAPPAVAPAPPAASSTSDYVISSVVCFGAGIAGTFILVTYFRKRRESEQQSTTALLEPSSV